MQIGADPVEHRHEVIGNHFHAAFPEIAQRNLVVLNILVTTSGTDLDILVHRQALHNIPDEPGRLDHLLVSHDLFHAPHFAVGDMMQRTDNALCPRLTHIFQRNRVFRTVPAE